MRLASAAMLLLSVPAFAGNLCVNPRGDGGCEKTLQSAINAASPGDTINVASGKYSGSVIVDRSIALVGAGLRSTVIDATGASNGIHVDGFDHAGLSRVIIRGFTVENANHQGILVTNASDVTITDNRVTGNDRAIQLQSNAAPTCPGLPPYLAAFQGMDCGEGIQLSGVTNSTVAGNVVDHNTGGILVTDDTAPNHDNFITNNVVRDNPYDCSITLATHDLNPSQGLPAKGVYHITVSGNTVIRNGLANGEGAGVGIFAPTPGSQNWGNVIIDNTLVDNGLPGVTVHSHAPGQNVNGHLIANNTIYGNGPDAESGSTQKAGIAITADPGAGPINGIRLSGNRIFGEGVDVVFNAPGELVAHLNSFFDSTGVANLGPGSVDATLNWWKCARGPGSPGCGSATGSNVQVAPALDRPDTDH
ncbi:MAG TPA: right-handed parallel beta-helix repeat-containing protein [Steroidobacteraceae bacterium]|jgi:parallel beta-helix repeat protein